MALNFTCHPERLFSGAKDLAFDLRGTASCVFFQLTSSTSRPTARAGSLYTGVTNNLYERDDQHADADDSTFVGRYHVTRLVYFESLRYIGNAIAREKQIKGWSRKKKDALIRSINPGWKDLSEDWEKQFSPTKKVLTLEKQPQGPSRQKKGALDDKK